MTRWVEDKKPGMPRRINLTEVAYLVCDICAKAWVRLDLFCQLADEMKLEPEDASREVLTALAGSLPKLEPLIAWESTHRRERAWFWRMSRGFLDPGSPRPSRPSDRRWDVVQRIAETRVEEQNL